VNRRAYAGRVAVSLAVGLAAAFYAHGSIGVVRQADDFSWFWLGGRALLEGKDPYLVIKPGGAYDLNAPFLYPLTTAMSSVPFALFSPVWGATLFVGLGAAVLTWGITSDGYRRLPILGSAPFIWACHSGQWSTFITASALVPAIGWLAAAKPTLGLAVFAYRPRKSTVLLVLLFIALSLVINPQWPAEWRSQLSHRTSGNYGIPLLLAGGPILLLALLRWRNPEARLLLVMACVPQSILFYDQLPLWLIARTRLQSMAMALLSLVGLLLGNAALPANPTTEVVSSIYWPMILATCYLPALAMVMRQPNVSHQNGEPLPPN
jgi:hypothetical protein